MMQGMVIDIEEAMAANLGTGQGILDGTAEAAFRVPKAERYEFIERVLKRFGAACDRWAGKGVLLRDIERMTRLSRQLVTRHRTPKHGFTSCFTATDVAVPAEMDARHGLASGPATRKLMDWAFFVFGDAHFERLAGSRTRTRGQLASPSASAAPPGRMGCRVTSA